jgi:hypothetical protein
MPFPTELNTTALRQCLRFFNGTDRDTGRFALAAWELTGFGLGKAFPNTVYVSDAACSLPADAASLLDLLKKEAADKLPEIIDRLTKLLGPLLLRILMRRLGL